MALAPDGTVAFGASPDFILPVQVLSARFRTRLKEALRAQDSQLLAAIPAKVWRSAWVVHSQSRDCETPEYLSRYVFKTANSSARLLWQDNHRVAFSYRDSATNKERTCILRAHEPKLSAGAQIDREAACRARSP